MYQESTYSYYYYRNIPSIIRFYLATTANIVVCRSTTATTTTTTRPSININLTTIKKSNTNTSQQKFFLLITTIIIILNFSHLVGGALTPEDTRFARIRCQNESITNDTNLRAMWNLWQFPDNKLTHCYIKCFLNKLGLINLQNRGLDSLKLTLQLNNRGFYINENITIWLGLSLDGTCKSYYQKWNSMHQIIGNMLRIVLYGADTDDSLEFYQENPTAAKEIGQTSVEFCNLVPIIHDCKSFLNLFPKSNKFLNQYYTEIFQCHLFCIYQHFHYFDAYGRVDPKEIILSIWESENSLESNDIEENMKERNDLELGGVQICAHRANLRFYDGPCIVAYVLHQCLLKEINNFQKIFNHRNLVTSYY